MKKRNTLIRLFFVTILCLFATTIVQAQTVTKNFKNESLKSVLKVVEQQTGLSVIYETDDVNENKGITASFKKAPVAEVLSKILDGKLAYRLQNKMIVIYKKGAPTRQEGRKSAKKVSGTVVDDRGDAVIGASIVVKGVQGVGAISDVNGHFAVNMPAGTSTLAISYMGYKTEEVYVGNKSSLNIKLIEDANELQEVVVVGYGVQKRESLTGSLQSLKESKLKDVTSPTVENMLTGKAPGVYVAPGSGQPGTNGSIIIRGKSTVNGSTSPLWVIDGVIVGSSAGDLNPNDIDNITILKDAASTAIYGSEGANGVIVVTTKSAKVEKMRLNISVRYGLTNLAKGNLHVMNGAELYDYYKSFSNVEQISFPRWNEDLRNSNFDWWKVATHTGIAQDYNVNLSGGNETLKSFLSLGYYKENGAVKGYDYKRYNFRMKTDYKPFSFLTIKPSISGSRNDIEDRQYSVSAMYSNLPWDSPYDKNRNLVGNYSDTWVNSNSTNYLYELQWNHGASTSYEFNGNLDFDIRITDWLMFRSVNNYRWMGYESNYYTDPRTSGAEDIGRVEESTYNLRRRYTNQFLQFNKMFGKHSVSALLAYEFNDYHYKNVSASGTGIVPGFEVLDVTTTPENVGGGISEWAKQSYFFRGNYDYDGRYLAEFSLRRDGASNFGDNAKYGNFFSVSAGWVVNKESWFPFKKQFDILKLRASYGSVGNRPSSLYPQYSLYSVSQSASYNKNPGALMSQIGNKDMTWEKTFTTGIGLDLSMFERIRLTFDYYNKNTSNLLYAVPVSGLTGVTSIWKNVGRLNNRGFELTLGADIVKTKDWLWSVDINLGHNKNEVKELYSGKAQIIVGDGIGIAGSASRLLRPGLDSDSWYIREWAGVNPDNGAPQWYKTVTSSDGTTSREKTSKYAEADEVVCGAYTPDIFGGISTNLSYKNFTLSAVFGYSLGGKIYNYTRAEYDSDGAYTDRNQMRLQSDWSRWEKKGDIATHPVASYNNKSNSNKASSRYLEDGDYFKLRTLTLSYNIKLPKYYVQNMNLFVTGENLFCITKYSGVDPELPSYDGKVVGTTSTVYPTARKIVFGCNLTF
jgi:TonB-linked SusC/RagA family outer membrane protein